MKKSLEILKTKLEPRLKGKVKAFFIGDPPIIPESYLPCLVLNPTRTETDIADNSRDSHNHYIDIHIVIDARQYFDATPERMVGTNFLMETMENENADGSIDSNSILGILRDNLDLGANRYIQNISAIDYTVRKRTEELITLEAILHLEIHYIVNR